MWLEVRNKDTTSQDPLKESDNASASRGWGKNFGFPLSFLQKPSKQNNIQNTALVSGKIQRHLCSLDHNAWRQTAPEAGVLGDWSLWWQETGLTGSAPWRTQPQTRSGEHRCLEGEVGRTDVGMRNPHDFPQLHRQLENCFHGGGESHEAWICGSQGQEEKRDRFQGMSARRGVRQSTPFFSSLIAGLRT